LTRRPLERTSARVSTLISHEFFISRAGSGIAISRGNLEGGGDYTARNGCRVRFQPAGILCSEGHKVSRGIEAIRFRLRRDDTPRGAACHEQYQVLQSKHFLMPCERAALVIPPSGTAGSNPPLNSSNPRVHGWNWEVLKVRRGPHHQRGTTGKDDCRDHRFANLS